jgi:REP element-mobilizing transposase RayT
VAETIRLEPRGAWHHVMNRGADGRRLFVDAADRDDFVRLMADAAARTPLQVHAYCVMGNHYHLLARLDARAMDGVVRRLEWRFEQRHRRRHRDGGPVFRGRHRTVPVRALRQLVLVSRYVHLNPVEAGLAARPEDWRWSSYAGYLDPQRAAPWLATGVILGAFGSLGPRRRYRAFVDEAMGADELRRRSALDLPVWPGGGGDR